MRTKVRKTRARRLTRDTRGTDQSHGSCTIAIGLDPLSMQESIRTIRLLRLTATVAADAPD